MAWHWPSGDRGRECARLSGHPGTHTGDRHNFRHAQSARRYSLRLRGPARPTRVVEAGGERAMASQATTLRPHVQFGVSSLLSRWRRLSRYPLLAMGLLLLLLVLPALLANWIAPQD